MEHVDKPGDDEGGRDAAELTESREGGSDQIPRRTHATAPLAAGNPNLDGVEEENSTLAADISNVTSMLSGEEGKSADDDCAKCQLVADDEADSAVAIAVAATAATTITSQSTISSTRDGSTTSSLFGHETASLSSASKSEQKDDLVLAALSPCLDEEVLQAPISGGTADNRPVSPPSSATIPGTVNREQHMSPSLALMRDSFREAENRRRASRSDVPVGAIRVDHHRSQSRSMERSQSLDRDDDNSNYADRVGTSTLTAGTVDLNWHFGQTVLRELDDDDDDHPTMTATTVPVVAYLAETETPAVHTNENQITSGSKGRTADRSQWSRRVVVMLLVVLLLLAVVLGAVLGGVCGGTNLCHVRSGKNTADTAKNRRRISTTEELYQAIDEYYWSLSSESYGKALSPIGDWNVSRLFNFSRAFDPDRHQQQQRYQSGNGTNASTNGATTPPSNAIAFMPDLSGWDMSSATTLHGMFAFSKFDGNVSTWNTSSVLDMSDLFHGASQFAGDVSQWHVGRVQSMARMFYMAESFEADVSDWDVSRVQDMQHMMDGAHRFSSDVSKWNVSTVTDMSFLFHRAYTFDSDLSQWDTKNVQSMESTFNYAAIFAGDVSSWNVLNVRTMREMFADAARFSSSISSWNVSNLQDMSQMFRRASSMNQSLCEWASRLPRTVVTQQAFVDSGCVETADPVLPHGPFCAACPAWNATTPFETTAELYAAVDAYLVAASSSNPHSSMVALQYGYPIGTWDVSKLTDFSRVFDPDRAEVPFQRDRAAPGVSTFNESLSDWDTSSATTMFGMFAFASNFNGNISTWNTSSVLDMGNMFTHAASFDGDIGAWDVGRVESMDRAFFYNLKFNSSLSEWNVGSVRDMLDMFKDARSFRSDLSRWNVAKVENMQGTFYGAVNFASNLSAWDVGRVTTMDYLFRDAFAFTSDLSRWNVSRVRSMNDVFRSTHVFQSDLSQWDVNNVVAMAHMFCDCFLFNSDLSRWNVSKVRAMDDMFRSTAMVESLSMWDVSKVESMSLMLAEAHEFNDTLSRWNVTKVKNMDGMFQEAKAFSSSISGWDVSNVYTMKSMFLFATSFDDDISGWNVSLVTNTERMFKGAIKFNSDLSDWDVRKLENMAEMFMSAFTYNHSLCAWADRLPATVNTLDAFSISGCLDPSDPVLQGVPNTTVGPFCAPCDKLV